MTAAACLGGSGEYLFKCMICWEFLHPPRTEIAFCFLWRMGEFWSFWRSWQCCVCARCLEEGLGGDAELLFKVVLGSQCRPGKPARGRSFPGDSEPHSGGVSALRGEVRAHGSRIEFWPTWTRVYVLPIHIHVSVCSQSLRAHTSLLCSWRRSTAK